MERIEAALGTLCARGLNVSALLPTAECAVLLPRLQPEIERHPSLLLLGSTGGAMWAGIEAGGYLGRADPVDEYCASALADFQDALAPVDSVLLWPSEEPEPLPVTSLGRLAGWGHRSPLGLDVHPTRGLWTAFRGVLLVAATLPVRRETPGTHPCVPCVDRPCLGACPVGAVGGPEGLAVERCFAERTRASSDCGLACASRTACPLGAESRYPAAQIAHHQRFGNRLWARWSGAARRSPPEWAELPADGE